MIGGGTAGRRAGGGEAGQFDGSQARGRGQGRGRLGRGGLESRRFPGGAKGVKGVWGRRIDEAERRPERPAGETEFRGDRAVLFTRWWCFRLSRWRSKAAGTGHGRRARRGGALAGDHRAGVLKGRFGANGNGILMKRGMMGVHYKATTGSNTVVPGLMKDGDGGRGVEAYQRQHG